MLRRPPRSTHCISSAASDVYKRQVHGHAKPPPEVKAIDVVQWIVGSQGHRVDPPNFKLTVEEDRVHLKTAFALIDLVEGYGCQEVTGDSTYISRMCKLQLQYISAAQNMAIYELNYAMTVRIPKSSGKSFIDVSKLN
eukprot:TRINITY_DN10766_c0_g1_i11.p1 TRINITY_DN10766_c0_g1~~TRINITY_DN10766_c0_g1_i11.p1  ORF type:complete len:145 (+),score=33.98 TRINITY_DN10766_c0_g1_i11:24-437(+)